jgi:hypothetical protein
MAWPINNWAVVQKWALAPLLNEFISAVNERLTAIGAAHVPPKILAPRNPAR